MSDTNRVQIGITEESTFGVTPLNPVFQLKEIMGAPDLAFAPITVISEKIRSDRQVSDLILVNAEAGGGTPSELSFGSHDLEMEAGLFSTWDNKVNRIKTSGGSEVGAVSATEFAYEAGTKSFEEGMLVQSSGFAESGNNKIFVAEAGTDSDTIVTTGNTVEATPPDGATLRQIGFEGGSGDIEAEADGLSSTLLDFTTLDLNLGEWIKIGDGVSGNEFDTLANNDWIRIESISAFSIVADILPTGWTPDVGSGKTIRVFAGDRLINGITKHFYTIEEAFLDHSPVTYQYFKGMVLNTFNISAPTAAIVTANAAWFGKDVDIQDSGRISGATSLPEVITNVFSSTSHVRRIAEGGEEIADKNLVTEITFDFNNNLRRNNAVGVFGAFTVGVGEFTTTGTLNTYFDSKILVEKVLNNDNTSLDIRFEDNNNQGYIIDLPRTKYSAGAPSVGGKNQDVFANLEYTAKVHETLGYTALIQRYYYMP